MKKYYLALGVSLTLYATPPNLPTIKTGNKKPIHFNINVDNRDESHYNFYFLKELQSTAEEMGKLLHDKGTNAARVAQEAAISSFSLLKLLWRKNNYKIIAGSITGFYALFYYEMLKLERFVKDSNRWCYWKSESDTISLLSYKQQDLASMLLIEIHHRYTDIANPTEFVRPLIDFMENITKEIEKIKLYRDSMHLLKKFRVEKLFWLDRALPAVANDLLARAIYLKTTFLSWAAEYKINHGRALLKALEDDI